MECVGANGRENERAGNTKAPLCVACQDEQRDDET